MKNLLFLTLLIFTTNINDKSVKNTEWVSKTSNKPIDTFSFLGDNFMIHRCPAKEQVFHGSYQVSKDTLIIKEREPKNGGKADYYRKKFLLKNDVLYPVSQEQLLNHRWTRSKVQMRKDYVFKKVGLSVHA